MPTPSVGRLIWRRSWTRPSRRKPVSTRCYPRFSILTDSLPVSSHEAILARINSLRVETPSWGYGNSGTRFKVFAQPGAARTVEEKLADAGLVHQLTGICPTVALHIPWDQVTDWKALKRVASSHGVATGAINPNLFQDDEYKLGSFCNPSAAIR